MSNEDNELTQKPGESLLEFIARSPKDTVIPLDMTLVTKDEWGAMAHETHPAHRMLELSSQASNRELTNEANALLEIQLKRLFEEKVVKLLGPETVRNKYKSITKHARRIEVAELCGLISRGMAKRLAALNLVRNKFVHDPNLDHFEHLPQIAINALHEIAIKFQGKPLRLRDSFFLNAASLTLELHKKMSEPHALKDVSIASALDYSGTNYIYAPYKSK